MARFGGICQMQVYLDHSNPGKAGLVGVDAQRERGLREHEMHHLVQPEGSSLSRDTSDGPIVRRGDKRCFVATSVYGPDAWQTSCLRAYRDTRLLPNWWGRMLVRAYYRAGPCLVEMVPPGSMRAVLLRRLLDSIVSRLGRDD